MFPLSMINYSGQEDITIARKLEHMVFPMSAEEFYFFFIEKTDVWKKASAKQKDYIKMVYPADQADHFRISRVLDRRSQKKNQYQDLIQKNESKGSQT